MLPTANWTHLFDQQKVFLAFMVIVSCVVIFHRLSETPLAGDDCYYSEVAKEMVVSGDYLTPQSAYMPNFHTSKPPVLFWMNALSGKLLSFTTFAMRLPSAIVGFIGVLALMVFVGRYFNAYMAFMSALVLTFTQQYLYHARSAVTDGPFAVFFSLSLFSFWAAREEKKVFFYYLMGVFLGLAVMTRQMPGFFILPVIAVYIIVAQEYAILKEKHFYFGLLLSAAIFLPWHIAMYAKHKAYFLEQYFSVTLMTAFKGYPPDYSSTPSLNPWYAYFKILLNNYWPWLPFFCMGLYYSVKNTHFNQQGYRNIVTFVAVWAIVPFLLFQLAKVKQYHYIVPLYIPFAIITAYAFNNFSDKLKKAYKKWLIILVSGLTLMYLSYPVIPRTLDSREYVDTILLVPYLQQVNADIITFQQGLSHYYNCFWFYGNKNTVANTRDEVIAKINSPERYYFVLSREDFNGLTEDLDVLRLRIIKGTEKSVLFSNL